MQVEQLDLVQLHWWDYSVEGMVETAQALDILRKQGLIRSIGLTNIGCEGLQQILDAGVPIVSNQVHVGGVAPPVRCPAALPITQQLPLAVTPCVGLA